MYTVEITLEKVKDYVPFYTLWAAKLKAQEWAQCYDVNKIDIIDSETGELFASYCNHELVFLNS